MTVSLAQVLTHRGYVFLKEDFSVMVTSLLFEGNYKNSLTGASPLAVEKSIYYKLT